MSDRKIQVWSCGGGSQSCAIAVLIIQGKLPKPDFSLIADTGREMSSTWAYFDSVLYPGLKSAGIELLRLDAKRYSYNQAGLFNSKDTLLIPAFTTENNSVGKLPNYCSGYWKRDVVGRYLSSVGVTESMRVNWIGFSCDEMARAGRMAKSKKGLIRFPLIQDFPSTRSDCVKLVTDFGWPRPPRSRCWNCPNQHDSEWREIKENYPGEFRLAVELQREMQEKDPHAWLHKSCKPLEEIDFNKNDNSARACDSGLCFI